MVDLSQADKLSDRREFSQLTRRVVSCIPICNWLPLVVGILGVYAVGCSRSPPALTETVANAPPQIKKSAPWFEEIATKAKLDFRHGSGHTTRFYMPEVATGGVGLLDYDGDGYLDVFCVNGGSLDPTVTNRPGNKLYRNLGDWRFEDVTERAGVGGHGEYGMGCACADYDNDGHVDIYVTNLGRNI